MKNWKTTLAGLITSVPFLLGVFHITLPVEVVNGIVAVGTFALGYHASDKT